MANKFEDWWWKARLGKAYYQLGLLRDSERQFLSSLKNEDLVITTLELCKVSVLDSHHSRFVVKPTVHLSSRCMYHRDFVSCQSSSRLKCLSSDAVCCARRTDLYPHGPAQPRSGVLRSSACRTLCLCWNVMRV